MFLCTCGTKDVWNFAGWDLVLALCRPTSCPLCWNMWNLGTMCNIFPSGLYLRASLSKAIYWPATFWPYLGTSWSWFVSMHMYTCAKYYHQKYIFLWGFAIMRWNVGFVLPAPSMWGQVGLKMSWHQVPDCGHPVAPPRQAQEKPQHGLAQARHAAPSANPGLQVGLKAWARVAAQKKSSDAGGVSMLMHGKSHRAVEKHIWLFQIYIHG